MRKIVKCDSRDYTALAGIWERSVRCSHDFLLEEDFLAIRNALIPEYFPNVELYAVDEDGKLTGFIGLSGDKIEMLFVDSAQQGRGFGSELVDFALRQGALSVDVNEQNRSALAFYKAKGFRVVSRDAADEAGRPYPILHLSF